MKIIFISRFYPYVGGRETIVATLAQNLAEKHKVAILTPDIGRVSQHYEVINYDPERIEEIFKQFNPDIVNSHTFYLTSEAIAVCQKLKIPLVLTIHGDILNFGRPEDRQLFLSLIPGVQKLTCVSKHSYQEMIKHGIPKNKVVTILNGINCSIFKPQQFDKKPLRGIFNLPQNKKVIITPARMTYYKGLEFLLRTIKKIKDKNLFFLISTPSGRYRELEVEYAKRLLGLAKKWKISHRFEIQFHEVSAMPFLYQTCDGLILPSMAGEELPISILEAMASGLPVIATKVGGIEEIINDGINGFLVDYGDEKLLAEKVQALFSRKVKIEKLTKKVREKILKNFSHTRMIRGYESLLSETIKSYRK